MAATAVVAVALEVPLRDRLDDGELHAKLRGQLQTRVQWAARHERPVSEGAASAGAAAPADGAKASKGALSRGSCRRAGPCWWRAGPCHSPAASAASHGPCVDSEPDRLERRLGLKPALNAGLAAPLDLIDSGPALLEIIAVGRIAGRLLNDLREPDHVGLLAVAVGDERVVHVDLDGVAIGIPQARPKHPEQDIAIATGTGTANVPVL